MRRLTKAKCYDTSSCLYIQIDDILDQVGQARYITSLDLAKCYWQVPAAEDQPKTAFITARGLYQFKRMPFGL